MAEEKEVLIVDDSEESVVFLSEILEELGYPFRVARNGKEAMTALRDKQPDLVLARHQGQEDDPQLLIDHGSQSGNEIADAVKQNRPELPPARQRDRVSAMAGQVPNLQRDAQSETDRLRPQGALDPQPQQPKKNRRESECRRRLDDDDDAERDKSLQAVHLQYEYRIQQR